MASGKEGGREVTPKPGGADDQWQLKMGGKAGGGAQAQVGEIKQSEPDTRGIHTILTKHTSKGTDGNKVAEGTTLHTLSDGGAAGAGGGDHGKGAADRSAGEKGNVDRNTGSKTTRSDSAPNKGWREYIAASGRLYYYHKATKTTQWKKPF